MLRRTIFITFLLTISGCVTSMITVDSRPAVKKDYQLNEVKSCNVGEVIFSAAKGRERDAYVALQNFTPYSPIVGQLKGITMGDIFYVMSQSPNGDNLYLGNPDYSSRVVIEIKKTGEAFHGFVVSGRIEDIGQEAFPKGQVFKKQDNGAFVASEGSFKTELIYNGKNGSNISVAYREFSGNLIRSAFSQNLTYDLEKEKTFSYKGVKVEVINATNNQLQYRILDDGNLTWMP
jgi:hypothetical protein